MISIFLPAMPTVFLSEKYKDLQPFGITEYHADVPGPVESGAVLAEHWVKPGEELLAVLACRHVPDSPLFTGEVLDITSGLSDGMVYFNLPEGMWRITFLVKTRAGIAPFMQSYSDKLNPEATRLYIEEVFESHYAHFKEDFGDTFLGFFADEPCFHNNTAISGDVDLGQPFLHLPWHQKRGGKAAGSVRRRFLYQAAGFVLILTTGFPSDTLKTYGYCFPCV